MTDIEMKQIEKIRASYTEKKRGKLDELRALTKRAERPAELFAYIFGSVGSLVLGTGMCLAMKIIGNLMPLGIIVGILGIAMVSFNYSLYKLILNSGKEKYKDEILTLTNEILEENN